MKISIVTSYYNRKKQLINTLKTIQKSKHIDNVEFIITDDCSSLEHDITDIPEIFPFVKVLKVLPTERWYTNPCVPFNKSINEATGDIIILQNPECLHVGDILDDIVNNINETNYLTYSVYSLNKTKTEQLQDLDFDDKNIFDKIINVSSPFNNINYVREGESCWYNHSIYRPAHYHFLSAITKKNMDKLGGFDERFSNGIGFDDDELLHRIKLLGLELKIQDIPFAIHQWHYSENNFFAKSQNIMESIKKNQILFENVTKNLINPHVN
jgi:GT2 family glycosyltransferase